MSVTNWVVLAMLAPAVASAETVIDMHDEARRAVHEQRCADVTAVATRMRAYDDHYYLNVFVHDPELAVCAAALQVDKPSRVTVTAASPLPSSTAESTTGDGATRDAGVAMLLSIGVTAGGAVTALAAKDNAGAGTVGWTLFLVGPSVGHWYAGRAWNPALGVRLASLATLAIGGVLLVGCADGCSRSNTAEVGTVIAGASALVYGGATLWEIASAAGSAREFNRAHASSRKLVISPLRDTRGAAAPGLALAGRF